MHTNTTQQNKLEEKQNRKHKLRLNLYLFGSQG